MLLKEYPWETYLKTKFRENSFAQVLKIIYVDLDGVEAKARKSCIYMIYMPNIYHIYIFTV